jgi:hypothetical protein
MAGTIGTLALTITNASHLQLNSTHHDLPLHSGRGSRPIHSVTHASILSSLMPRGPLVAVALLGTLLFLVHSTSAASNADNYFCRACGVVMEAAHKAMLVKTDRARDRVTAGESAQGTTSCTALHDGQGHPPCLRLMFADYACHSATNRGLTKPPGVLFHLDPCVDCGGWEGRSRLCWQSHRHNGDSPLGPIAGMARACPDCIPFTLVQPWGRVG